MIVSIIMMKKMYAQVVFAHTFCIKHPANAYKQGAKYFFATHTFAQTFHPQII